MMWACLCVCMCAARHDNKTQSCRGKKKEKCKSKIQANSVMNCRFCVRAHKNGLHGLSAGKYDNLLGSFGVHKRIQ